MMHLAKLWPHLPKSRSHHAPCQQRCYAFWSTQLEFLKSNVSVFRVGLRVGRDETYLPYPATLIGLLMAEDDSFGCGSQ